MSKPGCMIPLVYQQPRHSENGAETGRHAFQRTPIVEFLSGLPFRMQEHSSLLLEVSAMVGRNLRKLFLLGSLVLSVLSRLVSSWCGSGFSQDSEPKPA